MKLRLKSIECIQAISIFTMIISATLILGGAEYATNWDDFIWQFRIGIGYILFSLIVFGCMELLKKYERYRMKKVVDRYLEEIFENIKNAQQVGRPY